jgi:type III secretion protein U
MSGDSSEEKNLPPSQQKLKNLRDKQGQVPRSQDFVHFIVTASIIGYIVFTFNTSWDKLKALFRVAFFGGGGGNGFLDQAVGVFSKLAWLTFEIVGPILGVGFLAALIGTAIDGRGFPIAPDAIAPKFNKLNPTEGVKKIFKIQTLVEFGKGMTEILLALLGNYLLFRYVMNSVLWSPSCQEGCVAKAAVVSIIGAILIGLLIILLAMLFDMPISRLLFKRDQKMSITEMKREMKENYGSPEIRQARRALRQQAGQSAGFTGIGKANLLVVSGDSAVGIVYIAEQTPAPIIVAKGTGTVALEYRASVTEKGASVVEDSALVEALMRGTVGEFVPQDTFVPVARLLIMAGIIKL